MDRHGLLYGFIAIALGGGGFVFALRWLRSYVSDILVLASRAED